MDKWINLSLSRHIEFQEKLKIKDDQARNYENFDRNKNENFYLSEFNKNDDLIVLSDETEQEIKKTDSDDSLLAKKKIDENKKKKTK